MQQPLHAHSSVLLDGHRVECIHVTAAQQPVTRWSTSERIQIRNYDLDHFKCYSILPCCDSFPLPTVRTWFVLPAELLFTDLRVNCTVDLNEYVSEVRVDSWKGDACTLLPFAIAVGVPQFGPLTTFSYHSTITLSPSVMSSILLQFYGKRLCHCRVQEDISKNLEGKIKRQSIRLSIGLDNPADRYWCSLRLDDQTSQPIWKEEGKVVKCK